MPVNPALIGKAAEVLVAGELMRRGVEIAYPASDRGVDLLAFRLPQGSRPATTVVPIQVKARRKPTLQFQRLWFGKARGMSLVHVWNLDAVPEFYIFANIAQVEAALGPTYVRSPSWADKGVYNVTNALARHYKLMKPHQDQWHRIVDQLGSP